MSTEKFIYVCSQCGVMVPADQVDSVMGHPRTEYDPEDEGPMQVHCGPVEKWLQAAPIPDANRGFYGKYLVRRNDGSGEPGKKHERCEYYVLDLNHDRHAFAAMVAYSTSCAADFPELSRDLRAKAYGMTQTFEGLEWPSPQGEAKGETPKGLDTSSPTLRDAFCEGYCAAIDTKYEDTPRNGWLDAWLKSKVAAPKAPGSRLRSTEPEHQADGDTWRISIQGDGHPPTYIRSDLKDRLTQIASLSAPLAPTWHRIRIHSGDHHAEIEVTDHEILRAAAPETLIENKLNQLFHEHVQRITRLSDRADFTPSSAFANMLRLWSPEQMRSFYEMLSRRPECAQIGAGAASPGAGTGADIIASLIKTANRLENAVYWALGQNGEFRFREGAEGAYWWRKELRSRAFGPAPQASPPVPWAIPYPDEPGRWMCSHCSVDLFPPSYACPNPGYVRPQASPTPAPRGEG